MKGFFAFPAKWFATYAEEGIPIQTAESMGHAPHKTSILQTPTPCASVESPYADVCFLLDSIKGA